MNLNLESNKFVSKNRSVFFLIVLTVTFFVIYTLFNLQIVRGEEYYVESIKPYGITDVIKAKRGIIYDRNGVRLVENETKFDVFITTAHEGSDEFDVALNRLSKLFGEDVDKIYEESLKKYTWETDKVKVFSKVNFNPYIFDIEANFAQYNPSNKEIVKINEVIVRKYNYSDIISHIVGYTGPITREELDQYDYLDLDDYVGKFGLEKSYDKVLRGEDGEEKVDYFATDDKVARTAVKPKIDGQDIRLSIDIEYQKKLYEIVSEAVTNPEISLPGGANAIHRSVSGSVVVEDPKSGEILAMVSYPNFDSNHFVEGLSVEQNQEYLSDPGKPLTNKPLQYAQSPGSIIKPLTSLSVLDAGGIDANTIFYTGGSYTPEGQVGVEIIDAGRKNFGDLNVVGGICNSSNIFHVKAVQNLDSTKAPYIIEEHFNTIGLNQTSGLDLGSEAKGFFPTPDKLKEKGREWYPGYLWNASYGQGDVLMTPIGAVKLVSTLSNNGEVRNQTLIIRDEKTDVKKLDVDQRHFDTVKEGMACSGDDTSLWVGYDVNKYKNVANKTGTAETGQYSDGEEIIHAWEISFTPTEDPELAMSVFLENGRSGWQAGYISREFYKYYYDKNYPDMQNNDTVEVSR